MFKKIINYLKFIIPTLIIIFYINGNIHSHSKHPDDNNNPIKMIYRGVEFFWHRNLTLDEWNAKLEQDTQDVFELLINAATHKRNTIEQDKMLNDFRKHIKNYPSDKVSFLKRAGFFYVEYNSSFDSDYIDMIRDDTLFYTPDFLSPRTKELMDSITVYQKVDQTASVMSGIYKTWGNKDAIVFVVPNAKEIMRDIDNKKRKEMKEIYDAIFIGI